MKDRGGQFVSLYGDKLKKVTPRQAKEYDEAFESDVMPEMRFLVDTYTDSDEMSEGHRVMFFDIEVEVTDGFPDVSRAANAITSIAFYDALTKKYYCYVLDKEKKVNTNLFGETEVMRFDYEEDLLKKFFEK